MKIRYVEKCSKINKEVIYYLIEWKTLFGWKKIGYNTNGAYLLFSHTNKDKLLRNVLNNKGYNYNFITIIEYPSIKVY